MHLTEKPQSDRRCFKLNAELRERCSGLVLMRDAAERSIRIPHPTSPSSSSSANDAAHIHHVSSPCVIAVFGLWDGSGRQCSGSGDVQRRFAHFVIDQLRVYKERFHLHRPEIRQRRRTADVHVSCGVSVRVHGSFLKCISVSYSWACACLSNSPIRIRAFI